MNVGLAEEKIRWAENIEILTNSLTRVTGDVFVSSASLCYYGPFTGVYRD